METTWEELEENLHVIEEFKGYKDGLVKYKDKEDWIMAPNTAHMIEKYKVCV